MRIRNIKITQWRNFENIELNLADDTPLVCVVGANGTGKSHLLELIAACAHYLGLSQGISLPRGNPFNEPHEFTLQFSAAEGISAEMEENLSKEIGFDDWDRTLTLRSQRSSNSTATRIEAGGISDPSHSTHFGSRFVSQLNNSSDVHFLSLDADRAYPKKNFNAHEIAQAFEIDWAASNFTRGKSFMPTTKLYDEWMKYFIALENQSATDHAKKIRSARERGEPEPTFTDHFSDFAKSLEFVLPHLTFSGIDTKKRTLLFNSTALELSFDQLSGGEREIAFLMGQIDRFGLRRGLFLLDEPELHLNADLIRAWVGYLTGTVETGQIWLATHSLEAVEAAGQQATFVLERNEGTRKVDSLARLDSRPVLSALSRSVGTPAFSISQLAFAFVEGEESVGERERMRKLAGMPREVRFIECGSCNEVIRRVAAIKSLADEADVDIRIGGIVDRDFRSDADVISLISQKGVYALPVHEVENFFLNPGTMRVLLDQNGLSEINPVDLIQQEADARAGSWIFQNAMFKSGAKSFGNVSIPAKERAKGFSWSEIDATRSKAIQSIVDLAGLDQENETRFRRILEISSENYQRKREEEVLWKLCEGKQVLNSVARIVGFSHAAALISATFAAWERDEGLIPDELVAFRDYLSSL